MQIDVTDSLSGPLAFSSISPLFEDRYLVHQNFIGGVKGSILGPYRAIAKDVKSCTTATPDPRN